MFKRAQSRTLMLAALALAALCYLPIPVTAQSLSPAKSQPGYHRLMVGAIEVIALSDGSIAIPADQLLITNNKVDLQRLFDKAYLKASAVDTSVNAFLVKIGTRVILFDAGTAELFGPVLGKLPASLARVGLTPADITDILVTHIHTDHTGGLMLGSTRAFPNAKVHMEQKELDFWLTPANKTAALATFFDQAELKVRPYVNSGQVVTFSGATTLFPGLKTVPLPGHTPGHTGYMLESNGQQLLFWGDVVHVGQVQFPNPTITIAFDVDNTAALAQRKQVFAAASQGTYLVAGAHLPFPGIGRVARGAANVGAFQGSDRVYKEIGEYRFYPIPYVNDAVLPN